MDPLDLAAIGSDLSRLTDLLRDARLSLPGRASREFRAERDEILLTFDGYLEPRIGAPDAPIVAAIVGPSGTGKSTLLNSIAQQAVSDIGVVRPTTRDPMVWADLSHGSEYWNEFSARVERYLGEHVDAVLGESPMTAHLTMIDTPPLRGATGGDAAQAVALADLCIFVTTPGRYADGIAWDFLTRTRRRGIPILFVLNRLPTDIVEQDELLADFAKRLFQRELLMAPDPTLVFGVADGKIYRRIGGLDADSVAAIRKELAEVADPVYRHGLVDETVYATARMVAERARALTRPMAAELPVVTGLQEAVTAAYEREATLLADHLAAGELATVADHPDWSAAATDLAGIITRRAGTAAHAATSRWSELPKAAELIASEGPDLWRHGQSTANAAKLALDGWASSLESLASRHARRGRIRFAGAKARAASDLWRAVVSGRTRMPWRSRRKFGDDGVAVATAARQSLDEAMRAALNHDADRFVRYLGSEGAEDRYSAIVEQADAVDARLDRLAGQVAESFVEPDRDVEVLDSSPDDVIAVEIAEGSTVIELGGEELYRKIETLRASGEDAPSVVPEEPDT